MQTTEKIWRNGSFVPWEDAQVHVLTHALHYGTGVFEGIRGVCDAQGHGGFPSDAAPRAAAPVGRPLRDGSRHRPARPGGGDPRDDRGQRRRVLLRAADRVPRLRRDGAVRAQQPGGSGDRRLAVGCLPGRGGARDRRPVQGLELSPLRAQHVATGRQGVRPVHQFGAGQARGQPLRLRRGDPAQRAGLHRRRLRRERVRGQGSACSTRRPPATPAYPGSRATA